MRHFALSRLTQYVDASGVFPLPDAVAAVSFCNGHKISSRSFRVAAASMPLCNFDVAN